MGVLYIIDRGAFKLYVTGTLLTQLSLIKYIVYQDNYQNLYIFNRLSIQLANNTFY